MRKKNRSERRRDLGEVIRGEVGAFEGLLASDNAVAETVVEAAVVLAVDVALGREAADLAAEAGGKLGRVEAIDGGDATLSGKELLVITFDVVAEHGRKAHSGDHHALLGVLLALRGRDLGRRRGGDEEDALGGGGSSVGGIVGSAKRVQGRSAEGERV
ncbi:hypothetical protein V8G54_001965 [Vigna mungo]|uniref:Uncharacterized protein n=1 Tax=Vigna mungo TaxID=3915 RepID=A0AAQ3P9A3_VIGMU